jgi:hypothetical protein
MENVLALQLFDTDEALPCLSIVSCDSVVSCVGLSATGTIKEND